MENFLGYEISQNAVWEEMVSEAKCPNEQY